MPNIFKRDFLYDTRILLGITLYVASPFQKKCPLKLPAVIPYLKRLHRKLKSLNLLQLLRSIADKLKYSNASTVFHINHILGNIYDS